MALAFEAPRARVIIEYVCPPASEPHEPAGQAARGRGAERGGEAGQELGGRRRRVVDDVEDARRAALDGGDGGGRRVVDVHQRPDAGAVPADREAPLAQQLGVLAALGQRGSGPVEAAVAQDGAAGLGDDRLEVLDRVQRLAHVGGRVGVERGVLALDRVALAGVRPAGVALPHEPRHAGLARGGEQVIGALRAQPVGHGERLVEVAAELERGQRGELVHDDVGPRGEHGLAHGGGVERVEDDRLGAHAPGRRPGGCGWSR